MSVTIGIDLGTTYSCVAAPVGDRIEVIANFEGEQTSPSSVAFTEEQVLVGKSAVEQATLDPENAVFDVKRLMGMRYEDESVQKDMKHWPFKVVATNDGSAALEVKYKGQTKQYSPEQISAKILVKMKETAEDYLDAKVDKAVITVPAYFNDGQRQATFDAARIASLNVLELTNEPTAAALSYGVQRPSEASKSAGVIGTGGDSHLGGEDFVVILMDYCIDKFEKVEKMKVKRTSEMLQELRDECQKAKKQLSSVELEQIFVRNFFDGKDLNVHVFRTEFEPLCKPLFNRAISLVKQTLAAAGVRKDKIDEVLLVGGSTRIPCMREMLSKFFKGLDLSRTVPADHAVAYGAAVQAAALSGNKSFAELYDGSMAVVIKRNSRIPASATKSRTTVVDNQMEIL
ncbi:hsp70 [Aphelenchoides avenae]|nr:hsp70 [Aphelenchus avenae]